MSLDFYVKRVKGERFRSVEARPDDPGSQMCVRDTCREADAEAPEPPRSRRSAGRRQDWLVFIHLNSFELLYIITLITSLTCNLDGFFRMSQILLNVSVFSLRRKLPEVRGPSSLPSDCPGPRGKSRCCRPSPERLDDQRPFGLKRT